MINYEFWIDITIILLLIPTIFYTASLSIKIEKIEKDKNQMAELTQALRHATDIYAKQNTIKEEKIKTPDLQPDILPIKSTQTNSKDSTPNNTSPSSTQTDVKSQFSTARQNQALPPLAQKPEIKEAPSEAELELLKALKSIK